MGVRSNISLFIRSGTIETNINRRRILICAASAAMSPFPVSGLRRQPGSGSRQCCGRCRTVVRMPAASCIPTWRLGATRLAIRGLNERANQPMTDMESGVMAVCNGEIDNHRELRRWLAERGRPVRQETDVAVIPGLYLELGEAFVSRLVGAFAIAVWDPRNRRLILRVTAPEKGRCFTRATEVKSSLRRRLPHWSHTAACRSASTRKRCESIFSSESFFRRTRRSRKSGRSRPANSSSSARRASARTLLALADCGDSQESALA